MRTDLHGLNVCHEEEIDVETLARIYDVLDKLGHCVSVQSTCIKELLEYAKNDEWGWLQSITDIDPTLRNDLRGFNAQNAGELNSATFARIHKVLSKVGQFASVPSPLQDVKIEDVNDLIIWSKNDEKWPVSIDEIDPNLRENLRVVQHVDDLEPSILDRAYIAISESGHFVHIPTIKSKLAGAAPTEALARIFFDPFLADRERLVLAKENPCDSLETFIHNFVVRIIGREMEVGMLIPAPDRNRSDPQPIPQFYRVSAKIISGEGLVSYILIPATNDTNLKSIRFFRGTSTRVSSIDSSSTMITDMEKDLGRSSFESGIIYEKKLKEIFGPIPLGAGHSLGATTLQYMLVENEDIEQAYFFNGPGLPQKEVEKFNLRMNLMELNRDDQNRPIKTLKLIIRDTNTDIFSTVGTQHLGYQVPRNKVDVDYMKYFPRSQTAAAIAHVQVPDRENRFQGALGGHSPKMIDQELNRLDHRGRLIFCIRNEVLRQFLGPCIAAVIRCVRTIFRLFFGSRTTSQIGMQYGTYADGKWFKHHFKPKELEPIEADKNLTPKIHSQGIAPAFAIFSQPEHLLASS